MAKVTLRALSPTDWAIFRELRLRAITIHTGNFLAKPEDAKKHPQAYWEETLDGKGKQVFGLFDGNELIGITGVFTWREDPSGETGVMAMSYIEPEYRGKGYSSLFYKARIEFAVSHLKWKKLAIAHREGNEASRRAMIRHGFEFMGTEKIDWPDGTRDTKCKYELALQKLRNND